MQKFFIPLLLAPFTQGLAFPVEERQLGSWTINSLLREVKWNQNLIDMYMTIQDGSANGVYCEVIARAPPNTDLATWSFSNVNCADNNWSVSWGYQPGGNDAAVMTVVAPDKKKMAFFGFDHVNSQVPVDHLGNAEPSQVQAI
ncbi:hypothetical protein F5B19DRAFT_501857 [Rostrohypoxylon terebratum]|nr:hypothetical protein F5B19DRAFT_501857 [Rostrohypoxylon terebratum]